MPIPSFNSNGLLPPGLHLATWDEIQTTFGSTGHRQVLLRLLRIALRELKKCGCGEAYIDGSFVTAKSTPSDYDMCWKAAGVDDSKLDPVLLDFSKGRKAMKAKYGGDIFPAEFQEGTSGKLFRDFFQIDKATGSPKGIIQIDLWTLP